MLSERKPDEITAASVMDRLTAAARTLHRLPNSYFDDPSRLEWPSYVRDTIQSYGYVGVGRIRITPSPKDLDEMDEAIPWLRLMDDGAARIAWARANRTPWWKIAALRETDPRKAQRTLMTALLDVASKLNEQER